jgi:primosomal protein N' (replication factor Y) (superfamily II helicase)
MNCKVVLDIPLNREFDYKIPSNLEREVKPGIRVKVNFGAYKAMGFISSVGEKTSLPPKIKLKEIHSVIDSEPLLGEELFPLADFISSKWGLTKGEVLFSLIPKNVRQVKREDCPETYEDKDFDLSAIKLTTDQEKTLNKLGDKLAAASGDQYLLWGEPFTGKTEIYLRLISKALRNQTQALFLLPDIGLVKPFLKLLEERFDKRFIGYWHSKISAKQKRETWEIVSSGQPVVILGTRSACLLPFGKIGLAIIDEEQEDFYKQEENKPYYHARDIVKWRCAWHKGLCVLGSSTPSVESFQEVYDSRLDLLLLKDRISPAKGVPEVIIAKKKGKKSSIFSDELMERLESAVSDKGEALLIINKKGYSASYSCKKCGHILRCDKCGFGVSYHKIEDKGYLVCNRCSHKKEAPEKCPKCSGEIFRYFGFGTQKVVSEIKYFFPSVEIIRLDSDTLKDKDDVSKIYSEKPKDMPRIIVGTRIALRGYNFSSLSLVGMLDVDAELNMPDFRATERSFRILSEAKGKLYASAKVSLVIQTSKEDEEIFEIIKNGDYMKFVHDELEARKVFKYPPFTKLSRIVIRGKDLNVLHKSAEKLVSDLEVAIGGDNGNFQIMGPADLNVNEKGKFRYSNVVMKIWEEKTFSKFVEFGKNYRPLKGTFTKITHDPYNFR